MLRVSSAVLVSQCALFGVSAALAQTTCPVDLGPTGPTQSPSTAAYPGNFILPEEYAWVHSSTNLQGAPAYEKVAASLFYNPPGDFGTGAPRALGAFSSAIIVNNPDPAMGTVVDIEYFRDDGRFLSANRNIFIAPNAMHVETATPLLAGGQPGVGSARIRVVNPDINPPILGATLHYFDSIWVPGWNQVARDPDVFTQETGGVRPAPGEGSYQQLQAVRRFDSRNTLFAGPFRITNIGATDFENGAVPIYTIHNAEDTPIDATVFVLATVPGAAFPVPISTRRINLQPNATFYDMSLWIGVNQLTRGAFLTPGGSTYDFSLSAIVVADDQRALYGDALMIDVFANQAAPTPNMNFGKRFRMTSTMLADRPSNTLTAHDVGAAIPFGGVEPMIISATHVLNTSFTESVPVFIEYYAHDGTLLAIDVPAQPLPPGGVLHIGQGQADSPNFPLNLWNGWLRVVSGTVDAPCGAASLIGWTHREIGPRPGTDVPPKQFRKAYGEEMIGANRAEPGFGIVVNQLSGGGVPEDVIRKVSPLVRAQPFVNPGWWPGYTTFTNTGFIDNVGPYYFRFFDRFNGFDFTNYAAQPLAGVAADASSFTYEDRDPAPFFPLSLIPNPGNGSGRVDVTALSFPDGASLFDGINVLGDPFIEYGFPGFALPNRGPSGEIRVPPVGIITEAR